MCKQQHIVVDKLLISGYQFLSYQQKDQRMTTGTTYMMHNTHVHYMLHNDAHLHYMMHNTHDAQRTYALHDAQHT